MKPHRKIIPANNVQGWYRNGSAVIQARKHIVTGDITKGIRPGAVFDIYDWTCIDGVWYALARKMPDFTRPEYTWFYIDETLFDWDMPNFEIGVTVSKHAMQMSSGA